MRTPFATTWLAAVGILLIGAALRTQLAATRVKAKEHALQTLADGDRYGAMQHLMAVDGACRAAYRLLTPQGAMN